MRSKAARGPEEAFILGAMLALIGSMAWLAVDPGILDGHFYRFPVMGLTHVATLGWISMMIQGVLLRLTPMALGVEPRGRGLAWTTLGLWVVGGSGLVMHMGRGEWFGAWTSAILLLAAIALLPVLHVGVFRRAREGDWVARYAAAAMIHLAIAAGVGLFVALNKDRDWVALSPYRVLGAHVHLAELGWVTFMILGFGRKLLPSLAPPREREPGESRVRFAALEGGLLTLVLGFLVWSPLIRPAALVLLVGVALHVYRPLARLGRGEVRDRASFWGSVACAALLAGALLGTAVAFGIPGRLGCPPDRALFAYGLVAFLGWNLLAITGFALKLFPLWVWEERFSADLGRKPVPVMSELASRPIQEGTGIALAVGTALVAAGVLGANFPVTAWGGRLVAVGGMLFVVNFVRVARWGLLPLPFRPGPRDWERHRAYLDALERASGEEPVGSRRGPEEEGDRT